MKPRNSALSLAFLACTVGPAAWAQPAAEDASKAPAFTIVGARVFDGEHWLPPGTQVRVQHGLVLAVGPNVGLARGGTLIDGSGKTLLPESENADNAAQAKLTPAEKLERGRGAIVAGAHADLRLVNGASSQNWNGLGDIVLSWKNGVPEARRSSSSPQL